MKFVISIFIILVTTADWTSGSSIGSEESEYRRAIYNYHSAVVDLAADRAIGRSKDHYIATQQEQMLRLKDSILVYEKMK